MRIGFDATALPDRPVGAGNYIVYLVRALAAEIQKGLEWADLELVIFVQRSRAASLGVTSSGKVKLVLVKDMPAPLRLAWEQLVFPQLLQENGIDLLHSPHYTLPFGFRSPVVVTFHDMTFFLYPELHTIFKRIFFRFIIPRSAREAHAVIAVSESTHQDILRLLGVRPEKVHTIHLGIPPEFRPLAAAAGQERQSLSGQPWLASIRKKYGLPGRFILCVGLVEPRKNLLSVIRAFQAVSKQEPSCHLVVVGRPGWQVKPVYRLVNELGLSPLVHFTGYVPAQDLPAIYNLAELLVYPSLYEGFGLPVLEAMACGLPVITSNVASMPEIVADSGVLLPPREDGLLAQAVLELLGNNETRQRFSEQGRQRASDFTWQRAAQSTLQVYRYILKGRV